VADTGDTRFFGRSLSSAVRTITHLVVFFAALHMAQCLCSFASDATAAPRNMDPALVEACRTGDKNEVLRLLNEGGDVNAKGRLSETPLMVASENDRDKIAQLLLERAPDPKITDMWGQTASLIAAERGHVALVELFLRHEVDMNVVDKGGQGAFGKAFLKGRNDVVNLLLKKGADVNSKGSWGRLPLNEAAREGDAKTVKVLLGIGADANARDANGCTALTAAAAGSKCLREIAGKKAEDRLRRPPCRGRKRHALEPCLTEKYSRDGLSVKAYAEEIGLERITPSAPRSTVILTMCHHPNAARKYQAVSG
jgi:ankyrin repeat protein